MSSFLVFYVACFIFICSSSLCLFCPMLPIILDYTILFLKRLFIMHSLIYIHLIRLFWNYSEGPAHLKNYQFFALFCSLLQAKFFKIPPTLLVKCDSQLTVDIIPYNNRNDGGPAAGLLSHVEVPEKAIVPFMVNAFDYVTFIHRLSWDLPGKFWEKREIINFHNYWFLIWPSYFNLGNN